MYGVRVRTRLNIVLVAVLLAGCGGGSHGASACSDGAAQAKALEYASQVSALPVTALRVDSLGHYSPVRVVAHVSARGGDWRVFGTLACRSKAWVVDEAWQS
jgi:hypothetical protein